MLAAPWGRLLACAGLLGPLALLFAQPHSRIQQLAPGKFLVAGRELGDPNFAETVVLLVQYGEAGAMGLVVNRPTRLPVSRVLREFRGAGARSDAAYSGGPVAPGGVLAMIRSRSKPEEARHVFADVYLVSSKAQLQGALAAESGPERLRVYLGYAGWAPEQLENEVELGAWQIVRAEAAMVFDPQPETLWRRLIEQTEMRIAGLGGPGPLEPRLVRISK